jgi:hypothetical protein
MLIIVYIKSYFQYITIFSWLHVIFVYKEQWVVYFTLLIPCISTLGLDNPTILIAHPKKWDIRRSYKVILVWLQGCGELHEGAF